MKTLQTALKTLPTGNAKHYDQRAIVRMFFAGKTIAECAKQQKCSVVYAHRVLTTKVPRLYEAEQRRRKA